MGQVGEEAMRGAASKEKPRLRNTGREGGFRAERKSRNVCVVGSHLLGGGRTQGRLVARGTFCLYTRMGFRVGGARGERGARR